MCVLSAGTTGGGFFQGSLHHFVWGGCMIWEARLSGGYGGVISEALPAVQSGLLRLFVWKVRWMFFWGVAGGKIPYRTYRITCGGFSVPKYNMLLDLGRSTGM